MKTPKTMKIPGAPDDWPEVPVFKYYNNPFNEGVEQYYDSELQDLYDHCEPVYMEDEL